MAFSRTGLTGDGDLAGPARGTLFPASCVALGSLTTEPGVEAGGRGEEDSWKDGPGRPRAVLSSNGRYPLPSKHWDLPSATCEPRLGITRGLRFAITIFYFLTVLLAILISFFSSF